MHGQYIKDLSFENPRAPQSLIEQTQPQLSLNVQVTNRQFDAKTFEVALSIEANAKTAKDEPLFMLELVYAGTVTLGDVPQDAFGPLLFIETPRLLFPFARAVVANATRAIALLNAHLLPSLQTHGDDELEHRLQCQLAAWLSIFGMSNTRGGISHALGHQIGPMWNVPHGVTSCITLPHVMRFMAEVAADRFEPIADGFGVRFDARSPRSSAMECADRAAKFIGKFEVPTRLRDAGVPREEISRIAGTVLEEVKRANTVGVEVTLEQIAGILDAAY